MARVARTKLLSEMSRYFPDRWEVTHIEAKSDGDRYHGAIKIHCNEDDKFFLSDFSAKVDKRGRVAELTLDGVQVGKFVGKLHSS